MARPPAGLRDVVNDRRSVRRWGYFLPIDFFIGTVDAYDLRWATVRTRAEKRADLR